MNRLNFIVWGFLGTTHIAITSFIPSPVVAQEFEGVNGIVINLDGLDFYWQGPQIYPTDARDIPGHYWTQTSSTEFTAQHWNIGPKTELVPNGISQWWSSDAPDRSLLYTAEVVIDNWTSDIAADFAAEGFVHYHELVSVDNPNLLHPTKVGWFRHTALLDFTLDGGPRPDLAHSVQTGEIDFQFIPNNAIPYEPENVVNLTVPEPSSMVSLLLFGLGTTMSLLLGRNSEPKK